MLVAREKRRTNIAEYILYLWQVEDLIRACSFDRAAIDKILVQQYAVELDLQQEISEWYSNLALMMEKEHIQEKGHLQFISNLVNDLNEFHLKMLEVEKDRVYVGLYAANRAAIAELIHKSGSESENEVEACLNALYGFTMLKLKSKDISPETRQTVEGIAKMTGHLSVRYIQFENDDFEL